MIGHRAAVSILCRELPPATLLVGPPSIGKWTLVHHLLAHHRVGMVDLALYPDGLSAATARQIIEFAHRAPFGPYKVIAIRLDASSEQAMTILLKTVEEPPPTARFLMTSAKPVPPTLASRCNVHRLGLLSVDELAQVLISDGLSAGQARRAAALGRGQVRAALAAADPSDDGAVRAIVLGVVRAVALNDREQFDRAFKTFDETARQLLLVWLREAITRQWAIFAEQDTFGLARDRPRLTGILVALSQLSNTSARLGVRAALEKFLT